MKIMTLNVWGGRAYEPLVSFIKQHKDSVDVFCFQEVNSSLTETGFRHGAKMNLFQDLMVLLPDHQGFLAPQCTGYDYAGYVGLPIDFGNAIFLRNGIALLEREDLFEYANHPNHDYTTSSISKAQTVVVEDHGERYVICNFHGVWLKGTNKLDNEQRLEQSRVLRRHLDAYDGNKIVAGDFNLAPETQSFGLLAEGMRDLIKEYGVTSTRSSYYDKPGKFADYILVTPDVKVTDFRVLNDEVSDHLPLVVDVE